MSPDAATAEPGAESAAPAAAAATESAAGRSSLDRLPSIAEAFRSDAAALKGQDSANGASDDDADSDAPGVSAAPASDGTPAASKPGDATVSRRGAAARISEQQSEIDRLVSEREAERARAADTEARVQAQDTARENARRAALSRIGDDQEFATLANKRMRGEVLSYEDDEKLSSMLSWREHAADLWEMADRAHRTALASSVGDRAERYGLDRETAYSASLPDLLDHAVQVTEARVRKEQASEIAELKAELRGLRTRGNGAAAPTVGGASAPGGIRIPDDDADPRAFLRAGLEEAEAERRAAAGPSRPRR